MAVAIVGVLVVAYGDGVSSPGGADLPTARRRCAGAGREQLGRRRRGSSATSSSASGLCSYGLYEVLYKRYACPPEGTSAGRGMTSLTRSACLINASARCARAVDPAPLPHWLGWETFELPTWPRRGRSP